MLLIIYFISMLTTYILRDFRLISENLEGSIYVALLLIMSLSHYKIIKKCLQV